MASADRRADPAVAVALQHEPHGFGFFQAVRLLRLLAARSGGARGEPVRFATPISLEFPASEIAALEPGAAGLPPRLVVSFMGLTGPSGALPRHYTALLIERRLRHRDTTAHRFLDLFNHRLIRLFYEAWEKHHVYVAYERGAPGGITQYLLDLVGLGTPGLHQRRAAGIDDESLCHHAGLAAQRPRSAATVGAILSGAFGVPAAILALHGRWLLLPEADRTRPGVQNAALGQDLVLGDRVWDHQSSCRIRLGPLPWPEFRRFLPDGESHAALLKLARFLLGIALWIDLQLVLRREDVPGLALGRAHGARLGWTTWLKARPFAHDPSDVVLPVGPTGAPS